MKLKCVVFILNAINKINFESLQKLTSKENLKAYFSLSDTNY